MKEARSTAADYARFLRRGALFLLPIAIFCFAPVWFLHRLGELRSVDTAAVARAQVVDHQDILYGPAYTDCTQHLKMVGAIEARAETLVIGTSRSLQVRREFFRTSFYNAGGATPIAGHLHRFMAKVPEASQPKTLIVILDQFLLNEETDRHVAADYRPLDEALTSCVSTLSFLEENWPKVYRDVLARKLSPSLINDGHPNRLGVRAKVLRSGYRSDGSFRIAGAESFAEVRDRMAKGVRRYEPAEKISPSMVTEIEHLLMDMQRRNIHVVALLPPYAPTIWDEMHAIGKWRYVDEVYSALLPVFAKLGHSLHDYSDTRSIGLTDQAFYDGFHGSERAYAAMLADAATKDAALGAIVDVPRVHRLLGESPLPLAVIPDE